MISRFFIERPRFAFVISIVITLAGLVAIASLPVALYPNITPSQISVSAAYPGADARTVQETVIQPLETKINGVKKMLYITSTATDTGTASINVFFDIGTDGDMNTVNTQNRVNWANAQLPPEVQRQSVTVKERSSSMLQVIALYSPDNSRDELTLSNYAAINLVDELARIPGVGDVAQLGEHKFSMRVWLDPERMAHLKLTVDDVSAAINAQNTQISAGAIGSSPAPKGQVSRVSLQAQGRLTAVEEFANIVVRSDADGGQVRIRDFARVELGAESYESQATFNGKPASLVAIYQLNDANALEIIKAVQERLAELKPNFPPGIDYGIAHDATAFITASVEEVVVTLLEAVVLVVLVTFLFLQNWRATLVPTIAIPVSLIGTFAVMAVIGYSINTITLFALILAIGIVVDDAIVVIENVSRLIDEEHLDPKTAAVKTMEQVTGPVVATTLVLLAMFIPVCFLAGITGEIYRQFGISISIAVLISSINALTLSPALSSILLKPSAAGSGRKFFLFAAFDRVLDKVTGVYLRLAAPVSKRAFIMLLCYAGIALLAMQIYKGLPGGFIPDEDQGALFVNIQLPNSASLERSAATAAKLVKIVQETPGVKTVCAVPGYSILTSSQASNSGLMIVSLQPWKERAGKELSQNAIQLALNKKFRAAAPEAQVSVFGMPTIQGIGSTGGLPFVIEDTTGTYPERLETAAQAVCAAARQAPEISAAFTTFSAKSPQFYLDIDREKALKMGVALTDINSALHAFTGYSYVNDFNLFGKVYRVEMQAEPRFRDDETKLRNLYVRNSGGEMVPLGTLVQVVPRTAPQYLERFNLYSSATVTAVNAPGYSSGQAMAALEAIAAKTLPPGMKFAWKDMAYQEKVAGKGVKLPGGGELAMMAVIFGLALLFMYLFLVAQYESWMLPAAVLLSVPIAFLGAVVSLALAGLSDNIYTQVGFVLLFGIACKTAILIVEFAKEKNSEGLSPFDAAMFAAKLRFRAVLMTAISFILGTLPLVIAVGAGAASRRSLGTAVCGGMTLAVIVGTILIPGYYVAVQRIIDWRKKSA